MYTLYRLALGLLLSIKKCNLVLFGLSESNVLINKHEIASLISHENTEILELIGLCIKFKVKLWREIKQFKVGI